MTDVPRIVPTENGSLMVENPPNLRLPDGSEMETGRRAFLCRCGASAKKPFCDGSHTAAGFQGDGISPAAADASAAEAAGDPAIGLTENGPYHVTNIPLAGAADQQAEYWLCRCGLSKNKPFCDGSHNEAGWKG